MQGLALQIQVPTIRNQASQHLRNSMGFAEIQFQGCLSITGGKSDMEPAPLFLQSGKILKGREHLSTTALRPETGNTCFGELACLHWHQASCRGPSWIDAVLRFASRICGVQLLVSSTVCGRCSRTYTACHRCIARQYKPADPEYAIGNVQKYESRQGSPKRHVVICTRLSCLHLQQSL